ncbi:hypothetical protein GGS23DRAFT_20905 [Durotheca rogersii]|uniref:uncharacterized protein n=1 Tax=Durotheca rogersii TaxID=419775 RepID=UPI00221FE710|nr:uncharacterized protein GGS23DRAFT_20905 [Durotheca rogersii]KAI5868296.1 hypothetical protein GGS23DRAFT_20905 [Durotheca rogersii]
MELVSPGLVSSPIFSLVSFPSTAPGYVVPPTTQPNRAASRPADVPSQGIHTYCGGGGDGNGGEDEREPRGGTHTHVPDMLCQDGIGGRHVGSYLSPDRLAAPFSGRERGGGADGGNHTHTYQDTHREDRRTEWRGEASRRGFEPIPARDVPLCFSSVSKRRRASELREGGMPGATLLRTKP